MRLLNTASLTLEEFTDRNTPAYVILSHTWQDDEVLYKDMVTKTGHTKKGYEKLQGCCRKAKEDGFVWAWIDTCCINKESSTELSEAINSMFKYYKEAEICYAYLSDVDSTEAEKLTESRWFTRGWTLQELVAPPVVEFYSSEWVEIGTKTSLCNPISLKTGIPQRVLLQGETSSYNVAERMSWASHRSTTRIEDEAYCLMGIFDVNMPLLYGEGIKAFQRLQREIFSQTSDNSIFLWYQHKEGFQVTGFFAHSPRAFEIRCWGLFGSLSPSRDAAKKRFSSAGIEDYKDLRFTFPESTASSASTPHKSAIDPPIFTTGGLRMKLRSDRAWFAFGMRLVFIGLKYKGKFLCIAEKNGLRNYSQQIFQCDEEVLSTMDAEYLCLNVTRTPRTRVDLPDNRLLTDTCISLHFAHGNPFMTYGIISTSVYTRSIETEGSGMLCKQEPAQFLRRHCKKGIFGILVLDIGQRDTMSPSSRIGIVMGERSAPWCYIERNAGRLASESVFHEALLDLPDDEALLDRDALNVGQGTMITATFRRQNRRSGEHFVSHALSIAVVKAKDAPAWAKSHL